LKLSPRLKMITTREISRVNLERKSKKTETFSASIFKEGCDRYWY